MPKKLLPLLLLSSCFWKMEGHVWVNHPGDAAGAVVTLQGEGSQRQTTASSNGKFSFRWVPFGSYNLQVSKPGFETFTNQLSFLGGYDHEMAALVRPLVSPRPNLELSEPIGLCERGAILHDEAIDALDALSIDIQNISLEKDAKKERAALLALLDLPCFEVARSDNARLPDGEDAFSMKVWWRDGGEEWLRSYLFPKGFAVIPSDPRKTLSWERDLYLPYSKFFCPAEDTYCGNDAASWLGAIFDALYLKALERQFEGAKRELSLRCREDAIKANQVNNSWINNCVAKNFTEAYISEWLSNLCAKAANKFDEPERYSAWRDCVESRRFLSTAFPAGQFRFPEEGWLVVGAKNYAFGIYSTRIAIELASGSIYRRDSTLSFMRSRPQTGQPINNDGTFPVLDARGVMFLFLFEEYIKNNIQARIMKIPLPPDMVQQTSYQTPRKVRWTGSAASLSLGSSDGSLFWGWWRDGKRGANGSEKYYSYKLSFIVADAKLLRQGFVTTQPPTVALPDKTWLDSPPPTRRWWK